MDFWLLRLHGKYIYRGRPPPKAERLRCAKCGTEISWEEAAYIRISDGKIVAYCSNCLEEDLRNAGIKIV